MIKNEMRFCLTSSFYCLRILWFNVATEITKDVILTTAEIVINIAAVESSNSGAETSFPVVKRKIRIHPITSYQKFIKFLSFFFFLDICTSIQNVE